jgi:hypothetical protein
MPSDLSYWLISAPLKDGDPSVMLEEVQRALPGVPVGGWEIPELKVGHWRRHIDPVPGLPSTPEVEGACSSYRPLKLYHAKSRS